MGVKLSDFGKKFCVGLLVFTSCNSDALAEDAEDKAAITISADYVTDFVFRGVTRQGEAIQPAIEAKYGDFRLGAWSSIASGDESEAFADEINFYAGYGWDLGDLIGGEIGAIVYHYPQSGEPWDIGADEASTIEVYGALDFDTILSPSLAGYYDVQLETVTAELSIAQPLFTIKPVTLELSAAGGGVEASGSLGLDYYYGKTSATLYLDVTEKASIYARANYGYSSEDTFLDTSFNLDDPDTLGDPKNNGAWFLVGVSSTF